MARSDPTGAAPAHALEHIQSLPSWLTGRVATRARELVAEALAAEGLRLGHHAVLAAVVAHGPLAQAELVRRLDLDAKDVVVHLDHLQQRGLVQRRPDPADRRKNAVSATEEGIATLARCTELAEQANNRLLEPLSSAEQQLLISLLARLQQG